MLKERRRIEFEMRRRACETNVWLFLFFHRGIPLQKTDRRGVSPEDDGDYAKLRELPMVTRAAGTDHSDDNTSEDTKVSVCPTRTKFRVIHCRVFFFF